MPSTQNGGVAADGKSVTYKLKSGVKWADGQPFSADDVAFTFEYVSNKESSATTAGTYQNIDKVEALDPGTVKITFREPTGGWFVPFAGTNGQILPKHIMKDFVGAKSREAPLNTKLIGTGPYMVDDFKPGDLVIYKPNPNFRDASKLAFDRLEIKGGGDAVSAARAVFQTGEFDYSWNLQVEAAVLQDIMNGGKGDLVSAPGSGTEQYFYNFADNTKEVNGETRCAWNQAPVPDRHQGPPGDDDGGGSHDHRQAVVRRWPAGESDVERPDHADWPAVQEHQGRVRHRGREQAARRGRLQAGWRRHPGRRRTACG